MRDVYSEWKQLKSSTENDTQKVDVTWKNRLVRKLSSWCFQKVGSEPESLSLYDPFYEVQDNHDLIGVANIFLECLYYEVTLKHQVPIINQQGEVWNHLPSHSSLTILFSNDSDSGLRQTGHWDVEKFGQFGGLPNSGCRHSQCWRWEPVGDVFWKGLFSRGDGDGHNCVWPRQQLPRNFFNSSQYHHMQSMNVFIFFFLASFFQSSAENQRSTRLALSQSPLRVLLVRLSRTRLGRASNCRAKTGSRRLRNIRIRHRLFPIRKCARFFVKLFDSFWCFLVCRSSSWM